MVRSFTPQALATAALYIQFSSAALVSCPTAEVARTSDATTYSICPGTDYRYGGASLQVVQGVASTQDCVDVCSQDTRCTKAVYDKVKQICHVKNADNTGISWEVDNNFDTIRQNSQLAKGTFIARCPSTKTVYTTRSNQYEICAGSDYVGASAQIFKQVTTVNACADICSTTTGCKKAVYDNTNKVCHIKAAEPAASLFWNANPQYTTITVPQTYNPATMGKWSDLVRLPLIPVAAFVVPQFPAPDRLMFFSSWGINAFGGASGLTQFADLNFNTMEVSARQVSNTHHDMFCPAISSLQDGRIVIQGGSDAEAVSIYDPNTNEFTRGPDLKVARGYQTSTILSNGKIFTIGGAYSGKRVGKNGEIYDPNTNEWTYLPNADVKPMLTTDKEGIWREDNHAWLFGWKNGSVFQAGPSKDQHWYGTDNTGSVVKANTRDTDDSMCGVWVMYDAMAGKILSAGGSPDYTNSAATTKAHITTIGEPYKPSTVERVPDMAFPRAFSNAVVFPNGQVLVTGGQRKALVFTNTDGILIPELFDPAKKTWTQLAPYSVPRNYHSISILLPDSRVLIGGGGLCYVTKILGSTAKCDKTVDHLDGEILEPPFLFNADGTYATRPVITALTQAIVKPGWQLRFKATNAASLVLIRMGSVTHSVNSDQRRIPLTDYKTANNNYVVTLPTDTGILLPGFYYLFAVSDTGVPSLAKTVQVEL